MEFALANVTCEYDMNQQQTLMPDANNSSAGRRVRRSEELLRQAAEFVSGGETFQNVSVRFNIPISTIRFYMARKGILPRRKRGRSAAISPQVAAPRQAISAASCSQRSDGAAVAAHNHQQQYQRQLQENMIIAAGAQIAPNVDHSGGNGEQHGRQQVVRGSRSPSPSGPPFHFANYKLPELRPNLL
uniref:Uncharacterized protein n=1 Tax=Anopheles albimanus TaxID=7167 RepID=A0A182FQ06_ANOAL